MSSSATFSVSGGSINHTSAYGSTISGGRDNKTSTKRSWVTDEWINVALDLYSLLLVKGGKILPRTIVQLLLEESQILLMVSIHVFLIFIKIK